jgi:DNA-binding IclR family transcriptional regulator
LFLAYLPEPELDAIFEQSLAKYTVNTITSPNELRKQLATFRNQGYSVDYEEYEVGICAIAAPIFNRRGNIIAAIGCPSPTSRMTSERITEVAKAFKKAAKEISYRMGYS